MKQMIICLILLLMATGQSYGEDILKGTIRFGDIDPLSGKFKYIGMQHLEGIRYAAQVINRQGGLLGRKVEIVPIDSELDPVRTSGKVEKAILQNNIRFFSVGSGSHIARVVIPLAAAHNAVVTTHAPEAATLTGVMCSRNFFRTILNTDMHSNALAIGITQRGKKRIFCIAPDYSFGKEAVSAFRNKLRQLNPSAKIVGEVYHPIGATDFSSYIIQIMNSGADIIFTPAFGSDLQLLIKQSYLMGLKTKFACYYLDDLVAIKAIENEEAIIGNISAECYMISIPTEANKKFVDGFQKEFGRYPTMPTAKAYMAVMFWAEAVRKAGTDDTEAVIKAWEGLTYGSPAGKQYMRPYDHQAQMDGWIGEIVKENKFFNYPYFGEARQIPAKEISIPPKVTGCRGLADF